MASDAQHRGALFRIEAPKAKIGKDHSWPIGAELLSAALFDVPQSEFIRLEFAEADRISLREDRPPLVFEAEYYFKGPTVFSPRGSLLPSWRLTVRAVPRDWKHNVKALLLEEGLPQTVKPWLVGNAGAAKREGSALLRLWYDPVDGCLIRRNYGNIGPTLIART
ncbi:MAG TPA: hypothetical protein VHU18_12075 [Rhizomicrobium sp.]|jgi:hypothetical protein|nr:hypothetical protein [Rhizomicrobium sp.]